MKAELSVWNERRKAKHECTLKCLWQLHLVTLVLTKQSHIVQCTMIEEVTLKKQEIQSAHILLPPVDSQIMSDGWTQATIPNVHFPARGLRTPVSLCGPTTQPALFVPLHSPPHHPLTPPPPSHTASRRLDIRQCQTHKYTSCVKRTQFTLPVTVVLS